MKDKIWQKRDIMELWGYCKFSYEKVEFAENPAIKKAIKAECYDTILLTNFDQLFQES